MMSIRNLPSLTQRVITGLIMLALFGVALFALPDWGWLLFVFVLTLLAAEEFGRLLAAPGFSRFHMSAVPHYRWLIPVEVTLAVLALLWLLMYEGSDGLSLFQKGLLICICYGVALVMTVLLLPHWIVRHEWGRLNVSTYTRGGMSVVGAFLLLVTFFALVQLRSISPWALLLVMVLVWLADTAAYFAGRAFGKEKLAPKTSPGKTRAGAVGALLAVTLYALITAKYCLPYLSRLQALPEAAQWLIWVGFALLLAVLSMLGDLFESLVKRFADQKDSGTLLPGHGGFLDRIDSLLTTLPTAALIVALLGY